MDQSVLFYVMFAHITWVIFLYILLTIVRAPSIWKIGARKDGSNPWQNYESRIAANLSNQFEWPLFFYVACIVILLNYENPNLFQAWMAWIFVVGRLLHSGVQILTSNIRLRGLVFTINFLAVLGLWISIVFGV